MAKALHDLGYEEVNWNLGCPHKPVRKKQRGSGLLPHPERVDALLAQEGQLLIPVFRLLF